MIEKNWHNLSIQEVKEILDTDLNQGLSEEEVKIRQKKFGPNELPKEKPLSRLRIFLRQFRNPLIYILIIAGFIALILNEFADALVIFGAIFINTIVGYFQENKANRALQELKKVIKIKARVIRHNNQLEIDSRELVPGDIIILTPGNKAPADARLIESKELKTNEAFLTGEWLLAEKSPKILPKETPLADRDNMIYMGSMIEEGEGKAIVVSTASNTEMGKVALLIRETKEEKTPFQKKIADFSSLIGIIIVLICLFILIGGLIREQPFLEIFMTSVAVAVAAIPEGLPIAVTMVLALGMQRIFKKKGLSRKLLSAETLGNTSLIVTDKTGTLTEGKMVLSTVFTGTKELFSDGRSFSEKINRHGRESHILALKIAMLANDAFVENPEDSIEKWVIRGKPTERALLLAGIQAGLDRKELEKEMPRIDYLPFSQIYKYSASLHKISKNENILYVLGAPEKLLEMSSFLEIDGRQEKLSQLKVEKLKKKMESLASKGLRILACGYQKTKEDEIKITYFDSDKDRPGRLALDSKLVGQLVFVGFLALKDPLRKEAKEAINICRQAGLKTIIVSGDHRLTVKSIAQELSLPSKEKNIIEGKDLDKMSDTELQEKLKDIEIYTRVEPRHKIRIVEAWQKAGEIVAMTGDGINDAPALKRADVGIALGSGTDAAKEVSDLVLLNDNFNTLVAAIEEGRSIIDNIRKVITYLLFDAFTETILVGASIIFGWPLPITAVQILWINLIEDGLPDLALAFEPKEKDIMKRRPEKKSSLLTREMKVIIFIMGILTDLILLGFFFWLFKLGNDIQYIRTMIFAALGIDSFFTVFSCKNLKKNIWQINFFSNPFLIFAWAVGLIALLAALYLPIFQILLKTVALGFSDWLILILLDLIDLFLIELTKWYFITKEQSNKN